MKKTVPQGRAAKAGSPTPTPAASPAGKIRPVVIYPFRQPDDYADLQELYGMVARLASEPERFARPLTVVDRKTSAANALSKQFQSFRSGTVAKSSDLLDVWSVDTCAMWYAGLGQAFEQGRKGDVYWLIPGDFNYGSPAGKHILSHLHDLPEICLELEQDVCIGEIVTDHNNPKQVIDTYGTFALLYHWFPQEAQEIRQYTERPRSEFFAIRHEFLEQMLHRRWYAYEQTVVVLLQAVFDRRAISRFSVGDISDLPQGRESLASAMQQVERTERVLKSVWRERHQTEGDWIARYRELEYQSEQVLRTALTILQNLLG
jgi:hypothetical protein